VVQYINEARELGCEILPPDVNESGFKFTVVADKRIRFGLGAVRNVGAGAIESIIAGRRDGRYATLADLVERIDLRLCNKRVVESLIAAGACDSLGGHRKQQLQVLETTLQEAQLKQADRDAGQESLFGELPAVEHRPIEMPEVAPWTESERLAREKEVIGFFISGHPLERYREEVALFGARTTATLHQWSEHPVTIGAVVTALKRQISKKTGKEYARLVLEDFHGTAEAIVFPDAWAKLNQAILPDAATLLTGGYSARDRSEDQAPFIIEAARTLAELEASGELGIAIRWNGATPPSPEALQAASRLCEAHPGPVSLYIDWSDGSGPAARLRSRRLRVDPREEMLAALREMFGSDAVTLIRAG
jgi:DNA polymerase-3 subunit alpha